MSVEGTLIAGPWVGEFGWELFAWQAYVRALSQHFKKTIIICRANSTALYKDFATRTIVYNPPPGAADSFFMHGLDFMSAFKQVVEKNDIILSEDTTLFLPRRIGWPPKTHYSERMPFGKYRIKPEYIKFGNSVKKKYDYVFHIRNRALRPEDNWSFDNWKKLLNLLEGNKVACVGTRDNALSIDGADDLRGAPLSQVFDVLRAASCCFGSSSGPMHLASLCGCPHLVWSKVENYTRYTENWNPLKTPVLFDSKYSWQPEAQYIYDIFKDWKTK